MSSGRHRLLWQEAEIYLNSQQHAYLLPRAPRQLSVAGGHTSHKLADCNLQPKTTKFTQRIVFLWAVDTIICCKLRGCTNTISRPERGGSANEGFQLFFKWEIGGGSAKVQNRVI